MHSIPVRIARRPSTSNSSTTSSEARLRGIGAGDLALLLRAQEACSFECDALPDAEIEAGLKAGLIDGLVLEGRERVMVVCWQRSGAGALLTAFYREGSAAGFIEDCRKMLARAEGILREWGVCRLFVSASLKNPEFTRLMRYYRRLGFQADLVRSVKEL